MDIEFITVCLYLPLLHLEDSIVASNLFVFYMILYKVILLEETVLS